MTQTALNDLVSIETKFDVKALKQCEMPRH